MKRTLIGILLCVATVLILLFRPPSLVRALESRAVAGDWTAAISLADYYGNARYFSWTGSREAPAAVRIRRVFQRSEAASEYWNSVALNLLVRAAEGNDRLALFTVGGGMDPRFDRFPYPNIDLRTDYLARMLLMGGTEAGLDHFAYRLLRKRNSTLAESVRREAEREGLLWPVVISADDALARADEDGWIDTWATALRRDVSGARLVWIRERSRLLDNVDAGNQSSAALLDRIRTYNRTHPALALLDA